MGHENAGATEGKKSGGVSLLNWQKNGGANRGAPILR